MCDQLCLAASSHMICSMLVCQSVHVVNLNCTYSVAALLVCTVLMVMCWVYGVDC